MTSFLHILVCCVIFSLCDFIGYNATVRNPQALQLYRSVELGIQAALTVHLLHAEGWGGAAAFNLIWWTWGCDFAYYGLAVALNPSSPWENRSRNGLQGPVTWAWWTPYGLTEKRGTPLSKQVLTMQAVLGLSCAIILLNQKED